MELFEHQTYVIFEKQNLESFYTYNFEILELFKNCENIDIKQLYEIHAVLFIVSFM